MNIFRVPILTLFLICSLFFGSFVFADSGDELSSSTAQIYTVSYDAAELRQQAELLAAASTTYTVDDIYNILLTIFSSGNGSVIPVLQNMALNINGTYTSQYAISMRDYLEAISGASLYGTGQNALYYGATGQTIADFQFVIASLMGKHFSTDDGLYIDRLLASAVNYLSSVNSRLVDVSSTISNLENIDFLNSTYRYRQTIDHNFNDFVSYSDYVYKVYYNIPLQTSESTALNGSICEFTIPLSNISSNFKYSILRLRPNGSTYPMSYKLLYSFLDYTGIKVYFELINYYSPNNGFILEYTIDSGSAYIDNGDLNYVRYVPWGSSDFHVLSNTFSQYNIIDKANFIYASMQNLENLVPDSAHQAAKHASESTTNQALQDFTGSGSGAAKGSDVSSMKNISSSLQSGLNAGGSVSGATSVFSTTSGFWGWFSDDNYLNINYPYPAPVLNNQRSDKKSVSSDYIIDFLSPKNDELKRILGGLEW